MEKIFSVKNDFVNARLDKWFKRNVCEVPQSLIEKIIRKGKIKVNNKKKKSSYKLQKNDQIFVYNFNFVASKNKKITTKYIASKKELSLSSSMFIENNETLL